jgi:hypothetical protein
LDPGSVTLDARNLTLYPTKDSLLSWKSEEDQANPYIKIFLLNKIYLPAWKDKLLGDIMAIQDFQMPLQTSFNIKSLYTQ